MRATAGLIALGLTLTSAPLPAQFRSTTALVTVDAIILDKDGNFATGLRAGDLEIVRDTSTYYVIGYQPENGAMDGKFRKIELKSHVAGLTIRARKGYAAVTLPPQDITWK